MSPTYVEGHPKSHAPVIRVYKDFNALFGENRDHATLLAMGKILADDYFIHPVSALSNGIPSGTAVVLLTSNSFGSTSTTAAQNAPAAQASLASFVQLGRVLIVDMGDNESGGGHLAPGATGTPHYVFPSLCADATLAPATLGPDGVLRKRLAHCTPRFPQFPQLLRRDLTLSLFYKVGGLTDPWKNPKTVFPPVTSPGAGGRKAQSL